MRSKGISTTVSGHHGERAAADYLIKKGFRILEMNYRSSHLEIDIIAEDDVRLIFVEVKSRTACPENPGRFGRPGMAVTYKKRAHLVAAAQSYLRTQRPGKRVRLDVIEVYFKPTESGLPEIAKIKHIENAFGAK
ncbi:MAG: YraN family protein [Eubacteriales bacterium]|jgi:putative endonuclease